MDSQNGGKFKPAYAKRPQDVPTCMQLNQPHCLSAEHVNLHDFHASISYLPQLISLQAPVSESLLMHAHDVLATKTQMTALNPEIRSVIHSCPTVVRQFNAANGFPSLPESSRELLLETRSDLEYLQESDPAALMTGMQHYIEGLSTDCGPTNQVAGDLNGSMIRGTINILGLEDDHERNVGDNYNSNIIAARSLSMIRSNSSTDPRLGTDYSNNGGSNDELIVNSNHEEVDLIKGQMGISNGNTNNKDAVDYEKISNAGSSTIYFGHGPPLDVDNIAEKPLSNNSKRRLASSSIIIPAPPKRAQLECMSYQSWGGAVWDNNINGAMQLPASRPKKSSRNPLGPALNTNLKPRALQGSANDPQSIAARQRRERINIRLKALQELVPNGSKFDLVTMLEKAINYVKFLQLQLKVLTDDEFWRNADHLTTLNNDHNNKDEHSSLESSNVESKNLVN